MRILHVSPFYLPMVGGVEVLVSELIAEHRDAGEEAAVLTSCSATDSEARVDDVEGVPVCRVPILDALHASDPALVVRAQRRASDFLGELAPDVVHNHDPGAVGWLWHRVRGSTPAPSVLTLHSTFSLFGPELEGPLLEALRSADVVTAVSAGVADDVRTLCSEFRGPVTVIPNGSRPSPPPDPPPSGACVLAVGRLVAQKGYDRLVEALALPRGADLRVDVIGTGPLAGNLRARAERLGVASRFTLRGAVDPATVPGYLAGSAVVAMPSLWEGMPMAAVEAAWAGRAVVGADVPGLAAVVDHGVTGLLVDADDLGALADALARVAGDPSYAWELGRAARAKAETDFTLARCAREYREIYHRLCSDERTS